MPSAPMCAGVSKSGSPTERLMMSLPWRLSSAARAVMASVGDGLTRWTRRAIEDSDSSRWGGAHGRARYITGLSDGLDHFSTEVRLRTGGRPAAGDRAPDGRLSRRPRGPDAARRHRFGQDVLDRERDPEPAAADARDRAQQDARRAALWRVPRVLPEQRGRIFRLVLRLLPARGLRALVGHLHREGLLGERAHRADAPLRDEGAARAARHDHRRDRLLDLRPRRSRGLSRDGAAPEARRQNGPARAAAPPRGDAIHAQRSRPEPGLLSRARRRHRHLPRGVRARRDPRRALRRHHRLHRALRSAHR